MIPIRGGSGLGDALYVQAIARHLLVRPGRALEICSDYPDVFRPLGERVKLSPFRRDRISVLAHYSTRRGVPQTTQFQDCCLSAGLEPAAVPLRLDWRITDEGMASAVRAGVPTVIVPLPRAPFGRSDGYGLELLPRWEAVQRAIDRVAGRAFVVQVGAGEAMHRFDGIDWDLANQTTVAQLIDIVASADAVLGWCSFMAPLAESLGKPALFVWSSAGLASRDPVIRNLTPRKIFDRPTSRAVRDDAAAVEIEEAARALVDEVRMPALV